MSASAPWSVKGIDAKAREVAKDLARRSGLTLGEWLNQMILEGEDVGAAIRRERERVASPSYEPEDYDDGYAPASPLVRRRPPVYREIQNDVAPPAAPRRSPAFSSGAQPLRSPSPQSQSFHSQPLQSRDLRRRSIFEDRPREAYDEGGPASDDLGRVAHALESLSSRIEGSEGRSANAVRGVSSAVESLLNRLERSEAAQDETRGRLEDTAHDIRSSFDRQEESREALTERLQQAERLIDAQAERLEGLSGHLREERERVARVETQLKGPEAGEHVRIVEGALGKLANQLYESEQRSRDTVKDIREDMVGLSHRLTQMELRDPERAAQGVIDKVVAQLAQRLEQAEAQTSGAIKALEQAFTTLDARLSRAEERGDVTDPESVQSLQGLANELSRRVEDSRAELLNAMQDRSQTTTEELVSSLSRRIEETEHRSAAAIEKLGEDVMRIADNLGKRVGSVETANQEGLTRVSAEIREIGANIETRFVRGENSHSQALERLGGEIARISERLNAKMGESERRAAQAIEGVGQFVEQQRDQARADLAERIRQSEERTARQLQETRKTIDNKLARVAAHSLLSETAARGGAASARLRSDLPNPFAEPAAFAGEAAKPMTQRVTFAPVQDDFDDAAEDESDAYSENYAEEAAPEAHFTAPEPESATETAGDIAEAGAEDHLDLTEPLTASADSALDADFNPFAEDDLDSDLVAPAQPAMVNSPLGPRALRGSVANVQSAVAALTAGDDDDSDPFADIEVSRKTAPPRVDVPRTGKTFSSLGPIEDDDDLQDFKPSRMSGLMDEDSGVSVSTRDALAAARAAVRASMDGGQEDRNSAFALTAGVGRARMAEVKAAKVKKESGMLLNAFKASAFAVVVVGGGVAAYVGLSDKQATEASTPIAATATVEPQAHDPALLKAEYDSAETALKARAPGAIEKLKLVANQGYAMAQFRLGSLYGGEENYVNPDPTQARAWTQRAAAAGIPRAMYNLGTYYSSGYGGDKNNVVAANWFRKSAEGGVVQGQYNLGLMYQSGLGVPLDPSEAYKWLKIATKSDASDPDSVATEHDAAAMAAQVRSQLSDDQAHRVEDEVAAFKPTPDPTIAAAPSPAGATS